METDPSRQGLLVLVVDDHPVVRRGLLALLAGQQWVRATEQAESVASALAVATRHPPDVAVVDLGLPDGSGLDLTRSLLRVAPACKVLVLTMDSDPGLARAALTAGASGFLVKETDPDLVVDALRTVSRGGLVVGPHLHRDDVLGDAAPAVAPPFDRLTPRELQLMRLLAGGRSNRDIARRMGLAEKTVRNQVSAILTKIGAADRVQAALLARDHRLDAEG